MDPTKLTSLKVTIEEAVEADKIFTMLIGDEIALCRKLIECHAKNASLDI
jgi:DNA gyrase subunit B